MMDLFTFLAEPQGKFVNITISVNSQRRGTILLTPEEWAELSVMLNGGCFVDNEAKIATAIKSQIPMYMEGE